MARLDAFDSPADSHDNMGRRSCARKCERACCNCVMYLPLLIVYGLTTWAVWVQAVVGLGGGEDNLIGSLTAVVGIVFYILLNWSYTVAVFTDPGSPLTQRTSAYSVRPNAAALPTTHAVPTLTAKHDGSARFCKKCQTPKPDRAHHCSSCRRCVMKMDHHCPWLATCVGLRNYKPFLLFLIYTCLFCLLCFGVSGGWVWHDLIGANRLDERLMPVNVILLAVLAGILGLVLSGFTAWHVYLAARGQTTIESLEKTRYATTVRRALAAPDGPENPSLAARLLDVHANVLPGVTRAEEGESTPPAAASPARAALRRSYADLEAARERDRYLDYLDEQAAAALPHAFDLGWRRNLAQVFGPRPALWALPVLNSLGDGWRWEPSAAWVEARARLTQEREQRAATAWGGAGNGAGAERSAPGPPPFANRASPRSGSPHTPLRRSEDDSSDDDDPPGAEDQRALLKPPPSWNDVPDDFLDVPGRTSSRNAVRASARTLRGRHANG